ncbi:uncharacterized protein LOC132753499 isoform X2 [Ruditapes philippinarum]|uniref:uncharacterized protein LOC132753499 isoform X2 n=1 Tax=Ruditapes philippinarum TaxID=129788 RepID=UPI00295BA0B6|nr:uncharacterized protein LOC132753499 isoform X2 [Ruditapes philippinarum]
MEKDIKLFCRIFLLGHLFMAECQILSSPGPQVVCVGEDVDLDWVYGDADDILSVAWSFIQKSSTLTQIMSQELGGDTEVHNNFNIFYKTNGGVTLASVTRANSGTYIIIVNYLSASSDNDTVSVAVKDTTTTTTPLPTTTRSLPATTTLATTMHVSGCTSITTKYVIPGNNVTLQFQARTVNSLDSSVVVTNQILSNKNFPLLSALYKNGANTFISACNNCTFTGNAETGDLSIRLYNLQKSDGGRYKHSVTQGIQQLEGCVDVYILDTITETTTISSTWGHGILKQIYIKDNKVPVKGGEIQIGCDIVHFSDADTVRVYKTDSIPTSDLTTAQSLANCYPTSCFGTQPRHKFSSSNSGVTIKITNLHSSDDKKYWTCVVNNQQMYMQLTVYYFRSDMYTSTTKTNYTMAIILGAVCIAVLIYATGVTIMYKRKTKKEGMKTWEISLM